MTPSEAYAAIVVHYTAEAQASCTELSVKLTIAKLLPNQLTPRRIAVHVAVGRYAQRVQEGKLMAIILTTLLARLTLCVQYPAAEHA